jgi:hypothetical protein
MNKKDKHHKKIELKLRIVRVVRNHLTHKHFTEIIEWMCCLIAQQKINKSDTDKDVEAFLDNIYRKDKNDSR